MPHCLICVDMSFDYSINSLEHLSKTISIIQDNLSDGLLKNSSYWPKGMQKQTIPDFESLAKDGGWPDIFHYYFECSSCGKIYRLFVDTFHGINGKWEPLEEK
ncbi:MAG: hypothetical protein ABH858_03275 [Candidatus Omnitrophota bacterium]